jgi:hypothetical protein
VREASDLAFERFGLRSFWRIAMAVAVQPLLQGVGPADHPGRILEIRGESGKRPHEKVVAAGRSALDQQPSHDLAGGLNAQVGGADVAQRAEDELVYLPAMLSLPRQAKVSRSAPSCPQARRWAATMCQASC